MGRCVRGESVGVAAFRYGGEIEGGGCIAGLDR